MSGAVQQVQQPDPKTQPPAGGAGGGALPNGGAVSAPVSLAGGAPPASADWTKDLAPELKSVIETKGYKTPADLVNAYVNAERVIGADKITLPKDGKWDADSLKKMGVPESPEGYQLKRPEKLPDGMVYDEAFEKAALPVLHQIGIPPAGAQALLDLFAQHQIGMHEAAGKQRAAEQTATVEALRGEWGQKYDTNTALAQRAARHFGGQAFVDMLNTTGIGNNVEFVKAFAKVGALIAEDTLRNGAQPGSLSAEMAKSEIGKLQKDPAYKNRDDPGHDAAMKRMQELYQTAYAESAA